MVRRAPTEERSSSRQNLRSNFRTSPKPPRQCNGLMAADGGIRRRRQKPRPAKIGIRSPPTLPRRVEKQAFRMRALGCASKFAACNHRQSSLRCHAVARRDVRNRNLPTVECVAALERIRREKERRVEIGELKTAVARRKTRRNCHRQN